MFAEPSASRGKKKKEAREVNGSDKKEVQRATRAQRRQGGLRRGGDYEVEDVAASCVPVELAEAKASSEDEDEEEEEEADSDVPDAKAQTSPKRLPEASVDEESDEEIKDIKSGIRSQLLSWAKDPGLPMDEQKRCVRQLLAQWHPDKNRHIGPTATRIFQFIQEEVERIVAQLGAAADAAARRQADAAERKAQRSAEKSAKASALEAARQEKQTGKRSKGATAPPASFSPKEAPEADLAEENAQEFSLVVGHGPATTSFLRPWPRSHFSITRSLATGRGGEEILLFGGEAYDGRELTFYSDLYRLDLGKVETDVPLPWEKLYSAVPMIPGPDARSAHQAVAWNNFVYVFGGEWSSRDQKRYRQFSDLWRFDAAGRPGSRWEKIEANGSSPDPRSGHRMAAAGDYAVLFGGFSEDKKRRATYLDDFYALHLPSHTWRLLPSDRRAPKPGARAGGALFAAAAAVFVYGGTRPTRKGGDSLQVMEDLWRASLGSSGSAVWEQVTTSGEGPGRRSGLCHCPVSAEQPLRRLFFGGVADHHVATSNTGGSGKSTAEVAVFHQDVFLLDCTREVAQWSRLWPGASALSAVPKAEDLSEELRRRGGGADAQSLALVAYRGASKSSEDMREAPRGRMAAGCVVSRGALWIFGGSCESGPKQEVTLDDLWRLELQMEKQGDELHVACAERWECVLGLSDRATVWFDDSDSDSDEEEEPPPAAGGGRGGGSALMAVNDGGGVLSKKHQKEAAKRARMELKRERQQEKCEEKTSKREQKKERQRQQAKQA
ncbi:KLHDC4 [Symbiodinium sp. CCMP2592]|nr:KLHDC4 [Symbiodinium sp. CCMP2592]